LREAEGEAFRERQIHAEWERKSYRAKKQILMPKRRGIRLFNGQPLDQRTWITAFETRSFFLLIYDRLAERMTQEVRTNEYNATI